ncbi:hypothetical protein LTS07_005691 [Exophiala sideris]|uniref:Zn(2)-C6 fungal-type domain-containing protein n=1 Tax=Exophiala sideris TaxID=1016849 RepID=A0ABR0J839_9EURO|nr:hypothetical protein LTS07_005691 [Exophiala sideris]KAK5031593.1 hypothetical protein LTR13_007582 [Exophiala sideris]KAK5058271.1 hypothetical protein LTR69_006675 [Exophiala sideris]KAK5180200.1 hypothetical protein LTR44_007325 [Eurotiomycetes sp. CCFEE 6388]
MAYSDMAANMIVAYGNYPVASTFAVTDTVPDLPESEVPSYSSAYDADPSAKRHAACDECRKRKLKCSGEPAGCGRCIKQHLTCHYSIQSKMGRPRKRQRTDASPDQDTQPDQPRNQRQHTPTQSAPDPPREKRCQKAIERTEFENVCNAPISQSIRRTTALNHSSTLNTQASNDSSSSDAARTPSDPNGAANLSYPVDVAQWPDFSDLTQLPMLVQDSHEHEKQMSSDLNQSNGPIDPNLYTTPPSTDLGAHPSYLSQLPAIPACPCLPNLYLTLSTLSTLSAFPVSSGTIESLLNAHRTGRAVVYCNVCPQKFQTGSQNVMLSSMLITVLSDHWHRVRKATAQELKAGFTNENASSGSDAGSNTESSGMSAREDLEWRTFGYRVVRACVYGEDCIPCTPGTNGRPICTEQPYTLSDLCGALERRQKQWHNVEQTTGEFPERLQGDFGHGHTLGMTLDEVEKCEKDARAQGDDGLLCLRIVKHARQIMQSLDSGPPRLGVP